MLVSIKFIDSDGNTPITEEQFKQLECKKNYSLTFREFKTLEKIIQRHKFDWCAVKQQYVDGIPYDFIYDLEEKDLYNLFEGVKFIDSISDTSFLPVKEEELWTQLVSRLDE
jgi:hypothetical protein